MNSTAKHFSPRASLAALGLRLRRLGLFEALAAHVHVPQKTVRHTPAEKLYDAFVAILAGAHGLSEINTKLRADSTLQHARSLFTYGRWRKENANATRHLKASG